MIHSVKKNYQKKKGKLDNIDNPLINEIRATKLEHSTKLAAFRAEILQIKEAVNSRMIFAENVSDDALIARLLNLVVRTVLYVVLLSTKGLSVLIIIKETSQSCSSKTCSNCI